jgi:sugar phosphate isomerase/epimerase
MDIGASLGPYLDRIDDLPTSFSFVEPAFGEGEQPLAGLDTTALADRLDDRGLGAVVHLPYRQPLATPVEAVDTATLEYLDRVLAAAAEIGATAVVAHPRTRGSGRDRLSDRASRLRERADRHGLSVCFETTGYAGGPSLDRVGTVADDAGAAVCLDVGYAFLEAGTDGVVAFLDSYGDVVEHLHVHGARYRGDTHIPVGSGDVDLDALGPHLAEAEPATATIEVFTDDVDYLAGSAARFEATLPE